VRRDCDRGVCDVSAQHDQSPATMDRSIPGLPLPKSAIEVFATSQSLFILDWFLEAEKHISNQYSLWLPF